MPCVRRRRGYLIFFTIIAGNKGERVQLSSGMVCGRGSIALSSSRSLSWRMDMRRRWSLSVPHLFLIRGRFIMFFSRMDNCGGTRERGTGNWKVLKISSLWIDRFWNTFKNQMSKSDRDFSPANADVWKNMDKGRLCLRIERDGFG